MNRNGKIFSGEEILFVAERDEEFQKVLNAAKGLRFKELDEDKKNHNCFSNTVKELYPELFGNIKAEQNDEEAKKIRYMLAYGLYLFQKDKAQDEKRFLIQDFEELLAAGREVEINVGIAALKGLGKDLYVALPIGDKEVLVGFSEKNNDYPSILSSDKEVNEVLNNEGSKKDAKIAQFSMSSEPNERNKIVCSFKPVQNNSELKGQISVYQSNAEALKDAIANVQLPNEGREGETIGDRVNEILSGCKEKDKDSMSLILLEGVIAQDNWEKEKRAIASKSVSKDAQKMLIDSPYNKINDLNYGLMNKAFLSI